MPRLGFAAVSFTALYTDPEGADLRESTRLLQAAGFRVVIADLHSEEEVIARLSDSQPEALLVTYVPVTERVLASAPSVRLVSCASVGFDCVDLEAAELRGIWVSNVPDAATEEVADHALALSLALSRHLPFYDREVRGGGWSYEATGVPKRLSDLTLGVVGMGRIGRRLTGLAHGIFGRVIAHDPFAESAGWPDGVERTELVACLRESDVVSLHLPLTATTERIIAAATIGDMRDGAYLVNVSRGGLIDEGALLSALDSGKLSGAALDVTCTEPPSASDPLRRHPRILVTPHAAFYSSRAMSRYILRQAENVVAWSRNGRPNTPVNSPSGGAELAGTRHQRGLAR
jgi:phosphoglycerate dehydrogenase-like enzyme